VRTQFFVAFGFQMIADDTLTTDEWKKLRAYGKEKADYLAKQSVADFQSRMENNEQPLQN
jgi:N-acetylglutamate synthase-like GNAT family acetyltransferase